VPPKYYLHNTKAEILQSLSICLRAYMRKVITVFLPYACSICGTWWCITGDHTFDR